MMAASRCSLEIILQLEFVLNAILSASGINGGHNVKQTETKIVSSKFANTVNTRE